MDDIRNVVITIPIPPEILKSKELIKKFINSLPETLILEAEESEDNTFRFPEGCQFYNNPTIKAAFMAKIFNIHKQDGYITNSKLDFHFNHTFKHILINQFKKWKITFLQDSLPYRHTPQSQKKDLNLQ